MEQNDRRRPDNEPQRNRSRANYGRDDDQRQLSADRFGSERYDEQQRDARRGASQPEDSYSHRTGSQEFGSPSGSSEDRTRERNLGQHERDYGGADAGYGARRGYDDPRYRDENPSSFSPDWSREGAEARYSDDPYYARNRDLGESRSARGAGGWRGDQNRTTTAEQRERGFEPRGMRGAEHRAGADRDFGSRYPYGGRDTERRRDEEDSHYRGYYSRQYRPFSYPGGAGHLFTESWTFTGPHTGRGPKGWKRSDQQIIDEASQRLERDGEVDATDIEVLADNCVITLRGTVPDRATKRRAEEVLESIYGVRDVMNELRVASQADETRAQGSQPASPKSQRGRGAPGSQSSSTAARTSGTGTTPHSQEPSGDEDHAQKH